MHPIQCIVKSRSQPIARWWAVGARSRVANVPGVRTSVVDGGLLLAGVWDGAIVEAINVLEQTGEELSVGEFLIANDLSDAQVLSLTFDVPEGIVEEVVEELTRRSATLEEIQPLTGNIRIRLLASVPAMLDFWRRLRQRDGRAKLVSAHVVAVEAQQ